MIKALKKLFGNKEEAGIIPVSRHSSNFSIQVVYATDIFNHVLVYKTKILDEDVPSVDYLEYICSDLTNNSTLNYRIYSQTQIILMIYSSQDLNDVMKSLSQFGNFTIVSHEDNDKNYLFVSGSLYDYKQFLKNADAGDQLSINMKNSFYSSFYSCYFSDLIKLRVVEDLFITPGTDMPELIDTIPMVDSVDEEALNENIRMKMEYEYLTPVYTEMNDVGDMLLDVPDIARISKVFQSIHMSEVKIFHIIQNLFHVNVIHNSFASIERWSFKSLLNDMEEDETSYIRFYLLYQYDNGSLGTILREDEYSNIVLALQAPDCDIDELLSVTTIEEDIDPETGLNIEATELSYEGMQTGGMDLFTFDPERYQSTRISEEDIKKENSEKYDI